MRAASKLAEESQRERVSSHNVTSHNARVVSQHGDHARGAAVERSDSQRNSSKQV